MVIGIDASALLKNQPTGVENYARLLLAAMMAQPLKEERVVLYARGEKPSALSLPSGWEWKSLPFGLAKGWTHVKLSSELRRNPPDVFFSPAHEIPLFAGKAQVVTTVHDVAFATNPILYSKTQNIRQRLAVRHAVNRADRILAVSEATKQDLIKYFHAQAEKITVTHLAPTITSTSALNLSIHGKYFLYVGRIEEKKNTKTAIEAFIEFKKKTASDVKLVLAGGLGYGGEEIKKMAEDSAASKDIQFLGYVDQAAVPGLYAGALAFIFPSFAEGFGLPILEAMTMGTPVLLSDIPVFHEVAGSAAVYASPRDPHAFAEKMGELAASNELRTSLRDRGLAQAEKYSWDATAAKTWEALRNV